MTGERETGVTGLFRKAQRLVRDYVRDYTDNDVVETSSIIRGGDITDEQRRSYMERRFRSLLSPPIMLPMGSITAGLSPEIQVDVTAITAEKRRQSRLTPPQLDDEVRKEAYDRARRFKLIAN